MAAIVVTGRGESGRLLSVTDRDVPPYQDFLWPILLAVRSLGGSGSLGEITSAVLEQGNYTEEQQQVLHNDGPKTEIEYRIDWGRSYLKGMGLLTNSQRGVWSLTDSGRTVEQGKIAPLRRKYLRSLRRRRGNRHDSKPTPERPEGGPPEESQDDGVAPWRDALLEALMSMAPDAFERLAQRLLREAGFISATVTGRSGDGGIDGLGTYRLSLLSFPVFFQCKRYRGSVRSPAIRDFRGAMAGRGDKGLLITTGTFTIDAKAEATRDGAPPIDLIDGDRLCDLLKTYELGVRVTTRTVEDVTVDTEFLTSL